MSLPNRAALYMRVSTKQQKIDSQRDALLDYAKNGGYEVTYEYVDIGISGAIKNRPELRQLTKDAHRHKFDVVIVWKFDRFARSVVHLLEALEEFNHLGIGFISLTDGIDTKSPAGKALFSIIGVLSELEHDLIKDRVKAGMQSAKERGVKLGRPEIESGKKKEIERLASETKLSINAIHKLVGIKGISRASVAKLIKDKREQKPA